MTKTKRTLLEKLSKQDEQLLHEMLVSARIHLADMNKRARRLISETQIVKSL